MANKKVQPDNCGNDELPTVTLMRSENQTADQQKISEEIRYYLTQIILLADKIGRPRKDQIPEVSDAA